MIHLTPSHRLAGTPRALTAGMLLAAALLLSFSVQSHEGHDDAPAAASGTALPRFTAASELFELVGVVNGKQLTLYLDHAPTNAPVKDATLELEIGERKLQVHPEGEGQFEATLEQPLEEGLFPVTAMVTVGNDSDLLAGELDIHGDTHAQAAHDHGWKEYAPWVAGAAALVLLGFAALRARRAKKGGAA